MPELPDVTVYVERLRALTVGAPLTALRRSGLEVMDAGRAAFRGALPDWWKALRRQSPVETTQS
jgi:hypothetical protein